MPIECVLIESEDENTKHFEDIIALAALSVSQIILHLVWFHLYQSGLQKTITLMIYCCGVCHFAYIP